jgi:hypothetical protein
MGLAKSIRNALGYRGGILAAVNQPPVCESLEPRLLLSADGLANLQLDPLDTHSDFAPAIEVDLDYGVTQPATSVETIQEQETVSDRAEQVSDDSENRSNGVQGDFVTPLATLENTDVEDVKVETGVVSGDSTDDQIDASNSPVNDQKLPSYVNAEPSSNLDGKLDDETGSTETVRVAAEKPVRKGSIVADDGSVYTNDSDLSFEYATAIEIRGPPVTLSDGLALQLNRPFQFRRESDGSFLF